MYNKTIDIIGKWVGKVNADIVFWAGVGVVAAALILGIVRICTRRKRGLGAAIRGITKLITGLYFVFAYFVLSTTHVLGFSNIMEILGFPIAVVLAAFLIYIIFMGHSYCNCNCDCGCGEAHKEKKAKEQKPEKAEKQKDEVEDEPEAAEIKEEKETKRDKDDKKAAKEREKEQKRAAKEKQREEEEREAEQERKEREREKEEQRAAREKEKAEKAEVTEREEKPEKREKHEEKKEEEEPMFVVSKVMDDRKPEEYIRPASVPTVSDEERISNISRLAEQIERKRQANIEITEGKKENKFVSSFGTGSPAPATGGEPKVVARKITETVTVRPLDNTPKTGFTAKKITETTTTEKTYTGAGITASRTTTTIPASSAPKTHASTDSQKRADDILAALEKLRSSMKKN